MGDGEMQREHIESMEVPKEAVASKKVKSENTEDQGKEESSGEGQIHAEDETQGDEEGLGKEEIQGEDETQGDEEGLVKEENQGEDQTQGDEETKKIVWTTHTSKTGRTFYYNKALKQSSWTPPEELILKQGKHEGAWPKNEL